MPLYRPENVYHGINAHLHSHFQNEEGWIGFHQLHIGDLMRALQRVLPLSSGYLVDTKRSLQINYFDDDTDPVLRSGSRQDVAIYQQQVQPGVTSGAAATITPSLTFPARMVRTEEEVTAVLITRLSDAKLITRIELLSPANKPPGSHYKQYQRKRMETLERGVHLVEIDYLHERRSPMSPIPDYPKREPHAFPYSISVSNVHTNLTAVYGLWVDDPVPTLDIPLADKDTVKLNFGAVYETTFDGKTLYAGLIVDYEKPPRNFDSYHAEDRARIEAVMARAAEMR